MSDIQYVSIPMLVLQHVNVCCFCFRYTKINMDLLFIYLWLLVPIMLRNIEFQTLFSSIKSFS